jgi:hypothetical protein
LVIKEIISKCKSENKVNKEEILEVKEVKGERTPKTSNIS